MLSIFSVQNLQTFLRRKNLRPPSRPGPPGRPPGRGPPGPRGPEGRGVLVPSDGVDAGLSGAASLVFSSAIILLVGACCILRPNSYPICARRTFACLCRKLVLHCSHA